MRTGESFGAGVRELYRYLDSSNPYHQLGDGEYYERFVEGRIAKVWYWNADPVVLELREFPRVRGDGRRTVREVLEAMLEDSANAALWPLFEAVVEYQGRELNSVLAQGEGIFGGFRYGSLLDRADPRKRNVLAAHLDTPLAETLARVGKALWAEVPEEIREGVLFTVDAVLDRESRLWLLEMNPNPAVHPDAYPALLRDVVGRKISSVPVVGQGAADALHMKGQLVWATR